MSLKVAVVLLNFKPTERCMMMKRDTGKPLEKLAEAWGCISKKVAFTTAPLRDASCTGKGCRWWWPALVVGLFFIPSTLARATEAVGGCPGDLTPVGGLPPVWLVLPFVLLLLMIATGPLFYPHFWHRYYPVVAITLAAGVVGYYILVLDDLHSPIDVLAEYIQFIALIGSLFVAASGILIHLTTKATPKFNTLLLLVGAVVANVIGTTGASMLLIRPFMRLNKGRLQVYHIIFFIFMVSNVGGALTPIGDPPLFLGFLSGIPFAWTITHNFFPWLVAVGLLALVFYQVDQRNTQQAAQPSEPGRGVVQIVGKHNFFWLAAIIGAVFLDPKVFPWVPALHYHGGKFSFIRELIMLSVALVAYLGADRKALEGNQFSFEPLKEVVLIFIGIFGTMMPALVLIGSFAKSPAGKTLITPHTLYWGTGMLSSMLDNAPTYLNFLAASMAAHGGALCDVAAVKAFAAGQPDAISVIELKAIGIASVFFGAMTYIGNGPNFMVRAIAEEQGVVMPSFMSYVLRYSLRILLPILAIVWVLFFVIG